MITKKKNEVKGLAAVVKATKSIDTSRQWDTRVPMYYSIEKQTLYLEDGPGRDEVCYFLNPCSADDVMEALNKWLWR